MDIHIVTLFPELFDAFSATSLIGRATQGGLIQLRCHHLRDHGLGKHRNVDDTPYGGGSGMVMRVEPLVASLETIDEQFGSGRRILMSPQGVRFDQRHAVRLASEPTLTLICGRYEGFDDRVRHYVDEELSLGDFVMTGGEVAAMAIVEATVRLLPGVLGNEASLASESHSATCGGTLEYPHFTRPVVFRGREVPEVLRSGDHERIRAWRLEQAMRRTEQRRPDLLTDGVNEGQHDD